MKKIISNFPKPILYFLILTIVLNILRVVFFNNEAFLYLFWNIFLGFIPFLISSVLVISTKKDDIFKPFFIIAFILWFIFLPNAPYVITDFIHLGRIRAVPVMYDIYVLFASATVSLLFGLYSLLHIEKILNLRFSQKIVNTTMFFVILFASFGIYLGRFLRFNSWDLFTSHLSLLSSVWGVFTKSNNYINVYSYTFLFFSLFYISYLALRNTENSK